MRKLLLLIWMYIPFGYLLRFWKNGLRITVLKNWYVVIDGGDNTSQDALPINLVSEKLIADIGQRLVDKYKLEAKDE